MEYHHKFDNLDERWYKCHLCSHVYYPESELIEGEDGQKYCLWHYRWRFEKKRIQEAPVNITDDMD